MQITCRLIEAHLNCKYKAYLLASGRTGTPHDLEIVLAELQAAYREQAAAILIHKAKASAFTNIDIHSGQDVILGPTLEDGQTAFAFDALRRMDGKSFLGPFHYSPVLFWQGETPGRTQTLLMSAGGIILSRHQRVLPKTATVIFGSSCKARTIQLGNYYKAAQQVLDGLLAMVEAPRLILNDHCPLCEFRAECRQQAVKSDDLSLLGHMTEKKLAHYAQTGTLTVTQLSYTYHVRRHKTVHTKSNPRSLPLHALAIRQKRILVIGKPAFPKTDVRIYFDAEGDFDRKFRRIIEYTTERKKCAQCHRQFLPTKYRRVDTYRHGLKSWVMYQHVEHLVSLTRLTALCEEFFHMYLHMNYVCMMKDIMAERYRPTFKLLMQRLLAGNVIYVDETEISLRHGKGYVWVLTNFEEVVYLFRPNREAGFLRDLLKGFQGVVVSDFYSGYDGLVCVQQKCLIHLIRNMNTDLRSNPFDDELKVLTGEFATLLRGIVETIDRHGLRSQWLIKHKPKARAFLDRVCGASFRSHVAQGYKERFTKYRDRLFVFLERDGVSWNNNDAEHAIKYFAHYRMLVDGTVVESKLDDHLVLLSVCVTCKYKQVSFLRFMLSRECDIDIFAQQGKAKGRVRKIELYPKGFPNRKRKPFHRSQKENEDVADKNGVGDMFRKLLTGLKGYFTQAQLATLRSLDAIPKIRATTAIVGVAIRPVRIAEATAQMTHTVTGETFCIRVFGSKLAK